MNSFQPSSRYEHGISTANLIIDKIRRSGASPNFNMSLPSEITKIGFRRVLVSRVQGQKWIAEAAYSENGQNEIEAMLHTGQMKPYQDISTLFEGEAAHQRQAILRSAKMNPDRVHSRLHKVVNSNLYVAAPIIANNNVVGLIHADENRWTGSVDDFDRHLLGLIAQYLSLSIEYQQSVRSIFKTLNAELEPTFSHNSDSQSQLSQVLTDREIEVCHYLAQGKTNKQIGQILVIAEYTVKTHVQNILHKLGATNRSEAVHLARTMNSSILTRD